MHTPMAGQPKRIPKEQEMAEGIVKWFDKRRGFGFILRPDEPDLFVHFSGLVDKDVSWIEDGQRVRYNIVPGRKGPAAANVRPA
jgi:CspA family cold shock protein